MTWAEELLSMLSAAHGDFGVFLGLVALRHVENGREGREFGVLSTSAPTYAEQLHIAANSLRRSELRQQMAGATTRTSVGVFTDDFLEAFSHRWAPIDADNDPRGLNLKHAKNLQTLHTEFLTFAITALGVIPALEPKDV